MSLMAHVFFRAGVFDSSFPPLRGKVSTEAAQQRRRTEGGRDVKRRRERWYGSQRIELIGRGHMSKLASTNVTRKRLAAGGVRAALLCPTAALWLPPTAGAAPPPAAAPAGDWRGYGYDVTGRRFSPL